MGPEVYDRADSSPLRDDAPPIIRVLVAEDSEEDAERIRVMLEVNPSARFQLFFTNDIEGALQILQDSVVDAMLLDLSDSQTILRLKGEAARSVLIKGIAVDLHTDAFPVQAIAHTMVEHAGVLLHRVGPEAFELYVPRSYSANMWHWLTVSAEEFGYEVEA